MTTILSPLTSLSSFSPCALALLEARLLRGSCASLSLSHALTHSLSLSWRALVHSLSRPGYFKAPPTLLTCNVILNLNACVFWCVAHSCANLKSIAQKH